MFDYVIVGKGLFGAAAARYLSQEGGKVAIIGPDEPADWATHPGVFGSHYDQGRIATYNGPDGVWAQLDRASIDQYRALEAASGIGFYEPVGLLTVSPPAAAYVYPYHVAASDNVRQFTQADLPLPLRFPAGFNLFWEGPPTGYINPREMLRAQLAMAVGQKTAVIPHLVTHVQNQGSHVAVTTDDGTIYTAHKVLLAAGAFANCFHLLPRPLNIVNKTETTILAEVSPETAVQLAHMPPVNYKIGSDTLGDLYLLPPIRYPNGRFYLKLGGNTPADHFLPTLADLRRWFASRSHPYEAVLQAALRELMPNTDFLSWQFKPCVVCYTPHGKPFIGAVDERIFLATGGNGGSAHPSDAIGKLAADLVINGRWSSSLDPTLFQIIYA